jgi:hypothetical protein
LYDYDAGDIGILIYGDGKSPPFFFSGVSVADALVPDMR